MYQNIGGAGYHWSTTGVCNRRKDMQANVGQIKRKYAGNRWSTRISYAGIRWLTSGVCINELGCAQIID